MKSFYWAIATVMLIGTAGNTFVEILFLCIILCVTVGIFGYLIGNINIIISEMNAKSKDYKEDLRIMNLYMKKNQIPDELKTKVRGVLEHTYKSK